jgi:hypothetical protein
MSQLSGSCTDRGQQQILALRNSKYDFSDLPITDDSSSKGTLIKDLANFMAHNIGSLAWNATRGSILLATSGGLMLVTIISVSVQRDYIVTGLLWEGPQIKTSETQYSGFYII